MREYDGYIKEYNAIPKEELSEELGLWSRPFHVGEVVNFKGVQMEIIKIKKARKEIHLRFKKKEEVEDDKKSG